MSMPKKLIGRLVMTVALSTGLGAAAQTYPSRPVEIIVPFATGGVSDFVTRLLQPRLSDALKQTVVVVNKPGASGNIGTAQVARAPADGHTLLEAYVGSISINPALYGSRLPYDPVKDLAPVAPLAVLPMFLVVNASVPASTLAEFVQYARRNPGKLTYGSAGIGGSNHLAGELFNVAAGLDMVHVPYAGSAPAVSAVIGGHVTAMFDSGRMLQYVKSGQLKVLAVTTSKRLPAFPDIPTVAETYAGYEANSWHGLFAPAGTPKPIIDQLNAIVMKAFADPEFTRQLATAALEPFPLSADDFAKFIASETTKWGEVVRRSGAKAE